MSSISLETKTRSEFGKGASRRLRREALVPAIIYGGGEDPVAVTVEQRVVNKHLNDDAFYSAIINLDVDGKREKAILRDLQHHPYKPVIMHIDFQRVRSDEEIHVRVPLHFIGEDNCVGVKAGGAINKIDVEIEVACLPGDLPEFIEVDVSALDVGNSIHLSEVTLPDNVRSIALSHGEDHDRAIVSLHATRAATETEEEETVEDSGDGEG
ncbi:MAG TPA: 50S ribosomal protein L25 [Gammaproteobacteria bacterium]|nr:50S ribosomal protein L25 [Gammaproteobacteria bacterium]